ncbi:MAG TPA: hypothetical protein PLV25_01760, partial [Opitutales bacterium]|nr:hypothetical protein [Opitutales bacterium]
IMAMKPDVPVKPLLEAQQRRSVFDQVDAFVRTWEPYDVDTRVRMEVFWTLLERMLATEHAGARDGWVLGMGLLHSSLKARHWARVIEGVSALGRVREQLDNQQYAVVRAFIEDVEHTMRVPQEVLEAMHYLR